MKRSIQRVQVLWVLSSIFGLLIMFWQDFDSSWNAEKPAFLHFLDRHWLSFKQELDRKWLSNKVPSSELVLYEPAFTNRADFWFDKEIRKELADFLKDYKGSIILNLDPHRLKEDEYLKSLLPKENLIRPFYISDTIDPNLDLERFLSLPLEQDDSFQLNELLGIIPSDRSYFEEKYLYGELSYVQSRASSAAHFVAEYPLFQKGARYFLPSIGLISWMKKVECDRAKVVSPQEVSCKHFNLQSPLTLYFYDRELPQIDQLSKIKSKDRILIVNPVDSSSELSNIHGHRITWGTLVGTAISNLLNHDFPWRNAQTRFAEIVSFFLFLSLILYSSFRTRIRTCMTICLLSLIAFFAYDLLFSLLTGARTYPVETFLALAAFAFTGIATRASRDFEERKLIERALSGYVSEQRLQRLLSGKDRLRLEGRTRQLTTLLLDIAGFSKISKNVDHRQVFEFIQTFFKTIDPIIFKHGGTVDKKTGDGLLAFFGDYEGEDRPKDAAFSAVRAALEVQSTLNSLQKMNPNYFLINATVKCRIGVNSGELMIGNAGSERHFNYTVLGDSVNFTQRLEAACPVGEVTVGEATAKYIQSSFDLEEIQIPVKNESELYKAFLVKSK